VPGQDCDLQKVEYRRPLRDLGHIGDVNLVALSLYGLVLPSTDLVVAADCKRTPVLCRGTEWGAASLEVLKSRQPRDPRASASTSRIASSLAGLVHRLL